MQNMSREQKGLLGDFLLKQLENEIQAGFALVAAARRTLRLIDPPDPANALEQASAAASKAADQTADSTLEQMRALTNGLGELREAVDRLGESRVASAAGK